MRRNLESRKGVLRFATVRGFSVLFLLAAVSYATLAVAPPAAYACSCAITPLSEYADEVALAFAGEIVGERSEYPEIIQEFDVRLVFKGRVGRRVSIPTSVACELYVRQDELVGIAAFKDRDGNLFLSLCGSEVGLDELVEVFGEGYPADLDAESLRLQAEAARQNAEALNIQADDLARETAEMGLFVEDLAREAESLNQEAEVLAGAAEVADLEAEALGREAELLAARDSVSTIVLTLLATGALAILVSARLVMRKLRAKG